MKLLKTSGVLFLALTFFCSGLRASEDAPVSIEQILGSYASVQAPLVKDDLAKAAEGAQVLESLVVQWLKENTESTQKANIQNLEKGTAKFLASADIDDARKAFILISQPIITVIRADKTLQAKWQLFFCPMVAKNQGYWVQPLGEKIANPYMGTAMPDCGSKKSW